MIVTLLPDNIPTSSHPSPISTTGSGSEVIVWTLYDDYGSGQYRVLANDTNGDFYVWKNWASWTNNSPNIIDIDRTAPGTFNYTIQYYDIYNQYGFEDSVIVDIINEIPTSSSPEDIRISVGESESLQWYLYDDFGGGMYRVIKTDDSGSSVVSPGWVPWFHGFLIEITIDSSVAGIFNYTIEYYDTYNLYGIEDTVTVTIDPVPGISFGHYYFLFTILSVVSLVVFKKLKLTLKSKA